MSGSETISEMSSLANVRLATLRQKSFSELAALPEAQTEELAVLGRAIKLSTYRKNQDPDHLLIVVQALRESLLGMSARILVAGFVITSSGQVADAPEHALWDLQ